MRKGKLITIISIFIGLIITSSTYSIANENNFKVIHQESESIRIKIKVEYLGNPLEGAIVSIVDNGKVLAKSTTNRKGKVKITINDLGAKTVNLKIMKEGYKTQVLSGIILVNKSKYEFSLMKGVGITTSEVETDIPDIKEKGAEKVEKFKKKEEKYQEKTKKYTKKADGENQKRREIEKETAKIKSSLKETQKATNRIEEQLLRNIQEGLIHK